MNPLEYRHIQEVIADALDRALSYDGYLLKAKDVRPPTRQELIDIVRKAIAKAYGKSYTT